MGVLATTTKVLIIGSGLSGVALAQILRKENVSFEIFERDEETRSQGWTIGLDECLEPLYQLLPDDIDDLETSSPNHALNKIDDFTIVDGPSQKVLGVTSSKAALDSNKPSVFAERNKIRAVLMKNIHIQYGKQLAKFQEDSEGVTVIFKDGTSARGDILVGADGAGSTVRGQLLQGFKATVAPYVMFNGKVRLSKPQYEPLLEHSSCGILVSGGAGIKAYSLLMEFSHDETALFNWSVAWRSQDQEVEYNQWRTASPEALLDRATQLAQQHAPDMITTIKQSQAIDIQTPPLRLLETVLPDEGLPRGRVTLLGDAAHSMTPFRGMGANTAILDSCDLGRALIGGIQAEEEVELVLKQYEDHIIPRGRKLVLESRAAGASEDAELMAGGRSLR